MARLDSWQSAAAQAVDSLDRLAAQSACRFKREQGSMHRCVDRDGHTPPRDLCYSETRHRVLDAECLLAREGLCMFGCGRRGTGRPYRSEMGVVGKLCSICTGDSYALEAQALESADAERGL